MPLRSSDDEICIYITAITHDGRGLGFLPSSGQGRGKAVFVAGAVPGQTAACRIISEKKSFIECAATKIIDSALPAAQVSCPQQGDCGACPLMPLPYDSQLEWKEKLATDAMIRIGGLDKSHVLDKWKNILPSPQRVNFRGKAVFAFGRNGQGKCVAGFRKLSSHEICAVDACPILEKPALSIMGAFVALAADSGLPAYTGDYSGFWRFLTLQKGTQPDCPGKDLWWVTCLTSPGNAHERHLVSRLGEMLLAQIPEVGAFIHEERARKDRLAAGERRISSLGRQGKNATTLFRSLGGRQFGLDPTSFFQVNAGAAGVLASMVQEIAGQISMAENGGLLDLYCGCGAPGQLVARHYSHTLGIEIDRRAIWHAKANASAAGLGNCEYRAGDVGKILDSEKKTRGLHWTTVLADPPRSGMDARALKAVISLQPENIIYISCNPATLARDISILGQTHELASLGAVDMFPHTAHIECCALLQKKR